ncbi:hypothetical protein BSZ32_16465 [Rubritalea profundi]|uniref:HEAT repeat domain-containing protein n=1 Tax=Rubritalea profundi TaxID=1658618 RepID=A0A2S7U5Y4_9BACT|nr:hypothetical protein BSZ32_16465 [Rubritalea profundi]
MEILGPNFIPIVLNIALALSVLSLVLLLYITVEHWMIDRRQQHNSTFGKAIIPLIWRFLRGEATEETAIKAMQEDPTEALSLLIHLAHELESSSRPRLQPLFTGLIFIDEEIDALKSNQLKRRLLATERLGFLNNEASTAALLDALEDKIPAIRLCAARSLAIQGKTEAIKPILQALDLPNELDNRREAEAISDYGPSAVPTLLTMLESPIGKYSANAIIVAARVLGMLRTSEAVQPLIRLLKNPQESVRLCAARALGEIGDPAAISPVAALANDPAWRVRKKAMKAIGKLHADRQIPMLSNALSDSSWWVRFSAAQALHSLGQVGITELQKVMKNTSDEHAREICCEVLEEHMILDTKKN